MKKMEDRKLGAAKTKNNDNFTWKHYLQREDGKIGMKLLKAIKIHEKKEIKNNGEWHFLFNTFFHVRSDGITVSDCNQVLQNCLNIVFTAARHVFASAIATSNDEALNQLIFPSPPLLPLSKSD